MCVCIRGRECILRSSSEKSVFTPHLGKEVHGCAQGHHVHIYKVLPADGEMAGVLMDFGHEKI